MPTPRLPSMKWMPPMRRCKFNQEKIDRVQCRAPFDGVVLSGERDLMDESQRPKKEGDELFVIASSKACVRKYRSASATSSN